MSCAWWLLGFGKFSDCWSKNSKLLWFTVFPWVTPLMGDTFDIVSGGSWVYCGATCKIIALSLHFTTPLPDFISLDSSYFSIACYKNIRGRNIKCVAKYLQTKALFWRDCKLPNIKPTFYGCFFTPLAVTDVMRRWKWWRVNCHSLLSKCWLGMCLWVFISNS